MWGLRAMNSQQHEAISMEQIPTSKTAAATEGTGSVTLLVPEDDLLPFIKASAYGSRRKDECESSDLSDVMDFFDNGISIFSDSTLIKRWVGGTQPLEHEASSLASNGNHHHQNNTKSFNHHTDFSTGNLKSQVEDTSLSTTIPLALHHNIGIGGGADDNPSCRDTLFPHDHETAVGIDSVMTVPMYPNPCSKSSSSSSPPIHTKHQYKIIPMKRVHRNDADEIKSKADGNQALGCVLSALYGKLLVVMGIAFPMSEVISTYIPPSFYDGFYLYLYFGSITFMICIYGNIMSQDASRSVRHTMERIHSMRSRLTSSNNSNPRHDEAATDDARDCDNISCSDNSEVSSGSLANHETQANKLNGLGISSATDLHEEYAYQRIHFGSFYLRIGAVAFGIGSMIYSGLEFGQYFELEPDTKCHNFMIALTPAVRMIFTFMQMYFIFMNSKMAVSKIRLGAQFGLMHMIGTNLCVWLNVLVQETRHEILNFYNPDNDSMTGDVNAHQDFNSQTSNHSGYIETSALPMHIENETEHLFLDNELPGLNLTETILHRFKRGLRGPHSLYECRRSNIMGSLVQNASPFLFPCTIEYSLICAAILYVMWKSKVKCQSDVDTSEIGHQMNHGSQTLHYAAKRSPHHYSVDCARANKGLFLGIFILVMTIISLILYFVLITRPEYQPLATLEVNITELVLYTTTTVAVWIGMCQIRELRFVLSRNLELDNTLLIVAQTGSFIYNIFTVIGGHFTMQKNSILVMMTALASLIQLLFQTLFILDASKRCAATADQARRKPGREVVTFLLVTNLAMWAINTLEKSRADSDQVQLKFYGVWAWTILIHLSMPLAIFYRFHSTVCLCEIWKKAYKLKPMYR